MLLNMTLSLICLVLAAPVLNDYDPLRDVAQLQLQMLQ
jgi:hypothetical protein